MEELTPFERFKWNLLGDVVFEDYQGFWEPLWSLRGSAGGAMSEDEQQRWAERALQELHRDRLVCCFRVPRGSEVNEAALDPAQRLSSEDAESMLQSDCWRSPLGEPLPTDHPDVWIGPTPEGEAAANDPPDPVRRLWKLDRS